MLSHISVINFRNYKQARTVFHPGLNILIGPNGAGKTNMLEAISLFSPGRGLRHATLKEMVPYAWLNGTQDAKPFPGWGVTARFHIKNETHTISTGMDGETVEKLISNEKDATARRQIRIDSQEKTSQSELTEYLSIVWLTPQMDVIFTGGASERRRFLDRMIGTHDKAHLGRINRYDKALRQRNILLKEQPNQRRWIHSLDKELGKSGTAIAAARNHMAEKLNKAMQSMDTPFPKAMIEMKGDLETALLKSSALEVEKNYLQILHDFIDDDIRSGSTGKGPHKSDFAANHSIKNTPASYCSTGEQKAMLISLIMAHATLLAPDSLILLDEIAAHLDEGKRETLFSFLLSYGHQVFATGTDKHLFSSESHKAHFIRTELGNIII